MAKPISVDFSKTEDSGGFYIAPGTYAVKCTKVEMKEGDKAPYLRFDFNVIDHGVTLVNRCTLKADALFSLKNTLGALLNKEIPKAAVKIDPDKLVGRICTAVVVDREYNGKMYSDIARMQPYVPPTVAGGTPTDDLDEL